MPQVATEDQSPVKLPAPLKSSDADALTPRRSPRVAVKRKLISDSEHGTPVKWIRSSSLLDDVILTLNNEHSERYVHKLLFDDERKFLEVTRKNVDISSHAGGPLAAARVIIYEDGSAYFNIFGDSQKIPQNDIKRGDELTQTLEDALEMISDGWTMCGGVSPSEFSDATNFLRYKPACVERSEPFEAVHSLKCMKWFKQVRRRKKAQTKQCAMGTCKKCVEFLRNVRKQNKSNAIGGESKMKRQDPGSNYPWKYLSPMSRNIRQRRANVKRHADVRKIKRLQKRLNKYKVQLEENQSREMADIVTILNEKYADDVQAVIDAGADTSPETHRVLQEVWDQDTKDRTQFFTDQIKNKTGSHGNMWSSITYRVALAVYTKSPAAYESLKGFKILQLPSTKSLQDIAGSKLHEPGITDGIKDYLLEQGTKYTLYKEEMMKKGRPEPKHEGILIFDEVKVTARVKWSSKGEKFFGLEMNPEDFPHLQDIYEDLDPNVPPQPAQYMWQFMWRDLTSDYDIVGPYFAAARSLEHGFILSCILQTMRVFHEYGFQITGLVCDGASSNMAAIKILCNGQRGTFGDKGPEFDGDRHEIKAFFINPFNPTLKVFCCICPSHQLKNLVNALFQSRLGGTKRFCLSYDWPYFGWKAIEDLYAREMNRADAGQLRMVPKLKRSFVERDAWIKLSVYPAKIMQQTAIIRELQTYLNPGDRIPPCDSDSVTQWLQYLQALNKLFENGFLTHDVIHSMESHVIQNMNEGYKFFVDWFNMLSDDGRPFHPTNSLERRFLAWQTWDLLRICIYGFRAFCEDFLQRHGQPYYITPMKWNGSAVETIFSQFKAITGGKLDSTNYATARKMFLARRDALGHRPSAAVAGYRNVPLYVSQTPLTRR